MKKWGTIHFSANLRLFDDEIFFEIKNAMRICGSVFVNVDRRKYLPRHVKMIIGLAQSTLLKELIERIEGYTMPESPCNKVWESHPKVFWMLRMNFEVGEALAVDRFMQARTLHALKPSRLGFHETRRCYTISPSSHLSRNSIKFAKDSERLGLNLLYYYLLTTT